MFGSFFETGSSKKPTGLKLIGDTYYLDNGATSTGIKQGGDGKFYRNGREIQGAKDIATALKMEGFS